MKTLYKYTTPDAPYALTYNLILDDSFELTKCRTIGYEYGNYMCVTSGQSELIDSLAKEGVEVYHLPLEVVILIFKEIKFLEKEPPMISIKDFNQKLRKIREEVIFVYSTYPLYKLAWIDEDTCVTLCELNTTTKEITLRKTNLSRIIINPCFLNTIIYVGEDAKKIWNENI